jgi:hypothetical protein
MKTNIARIVLGLLALVFCFGWPGSSLPSGISEAAVGLGAQAQKGETITGELEVIAECEEDTGRTLYFVKTDKERLKIHFKSEPKQELKTGMQVNLRGVRSGNEVAADDGSLQIESTAAMSSAAATTQNAIASGTFGEEKVLVLLVNFRNDTRQPLTTDQSNNIMFNSANSSSVTNYYQEDSYGQTWVTGDTRGWLTMGLDATCDYAQIASNAKQAAQAAGIDLSSYMHYMYVFPNQSCGWTGLGTVGGSETWINGSLKLRTAAHELGHNLGLQHSRSLSCNGSVVGSNCTTSEYGHMADMMGACTGHFHPYQKERLGWLNYGASPPLTTIQTSGTYFLSTISMNSSSPKGLRILKSINSSGQKIWYYFEYRQPIGFDGCISTYYQSNISKGILVTMDTEGNGLENYQLDMNPQTPAFEDSALGLNAVYSDANAGFSITPISMDSTGVYVQVTFGGNPVPSPTPTPIPTATPTPIPSPSPSPTPSCVIANPAVTVSPATTQWIAPGGSANYNISVKNNNSSGCTSNSFNLQAGLPSGWAVSSATPIIMVSPGSTGNGNIQVTSPPSAPSGNVSAQVGVANSTLPTSAATVQRDITVFTALGVAVSTDRSVYTTSQTVVISAYVSGNGSPLSGVAVSFSLVKPNGKSVNVSATTAANGYASYSYRLNKRQDPLGVYQVNATANLNGVTGNGSASFEVH